MPGDIWKQLSSSMFYYWKEPLSFDAFNFTLTAKYLKQQLDSYELLFAAKLSIKFPLVQATQLATQSNDRELLDIVERQDLQQFKEITGCELDCELYIFTPNNRLLYRREMDSIDLGNGPIAKIFFLLKLSRYGTIFIDDIFEHLHPIAAETLAMLLMDKEIKKSVIIITCALIPPELHSNTYVLGPNNAVILCKEHRYALELFLSGKLLLVEGESDRIFVKALFSTILSGKTLLSENTQREILLWNVQAMQGLNNLKSLFPFLETLGIRFKVLFNHDVLGEKPKNSLLLTLIKKFYGVDVAIDFENL